MVKGFKSIAAKGGLKVHLADLGVDYDYFCELDDMKVIKNATIAKILSEGREHKLQGRTIKNWRAVRLIERTSDYYGGHEI